MKCQRFSIHMEQILTLIGFLMLCSEIWKQYVLTFIINNGNYDWWYFPFQLCSIPMYLLLLLPFVHRSYSRQIFFTFLMDFSLLSGACAFLDTSGMQYPLFSLTLHSYVWHLLLITIGLLCGLSEKADYTWRGFLFSSGLFIIFCGFAELLNITIGRVADINMFYISPYYNMTQVFISDLTGMVSNPLLILLYITVILLGAACLHLIWKILFRHK